jgi:hypothetical protein
MKSLKDIHKELTTYFNDMGYDTPKTLLNELKLHIAEDKEVEMKAQMAHIYHFASDALLKLGRDKLTGSGLIVQITCLGGKEGCTPFCVSDGFSDTTINALLDDIQYSYDKEVSWKPTTKRKGIK